jgi:hypothetical protein
MIANILVHRVSSYCVRVHGGEADVMRQSGDSAIKVPRAMIFGLIVAPLLPGFAAVINIIGDPRLHGVRSVDMIRLIAIGWCAGILFSGLLLLISSKVRQT